MGSLSLRWVILIALISFLVSRIVISFIRLNNGDIGTMFRTINDDKVEVCAFIKSLSITNTYEEIFLNPPVPRNVCVCC